MTLLNILGLVGAMFFLAITPGPGVCATVSRAIASGFKQSSIVVAGIVTGDLIFLLCAIYGLSVIAEILSGFFVAVKYIGGIYLIWMGLKIWHTKPSLNITKDVKDLSWKSNFFSGLAITLSNPKVILFYLGFLPTFVDFKVLSSFDIVIISLIVSVVLVGVMLAYAYLSIGAKSFLVDEKRQRIMNRMAGVVMIITGGFLLTKA